MLPTIRKTTIIQKYTFQKGFLGTYKIPFPDNEDLRNIKLWGVQSYYGNSLALTTPIFDGILIGDPDYKDYIIPKYTFQGTFLTLYDKNNVEFLKQCPIVVFQTIQNSTMQIARDNYFTFDICERDNKVFTGQFLDLQNSYYEIINATLDGEYSLITEFYYSRIDLDTQTKIN
ncbi:MAG: hypothetical protein WCO54_08810 [Bacteroidota bacterium]